MSALDPELHTEEGRSPAQQTLDWHDGDMPYSHEFGDHFYCRTDGRLECGHVFLAGNGLPQRWQDMASPAGDKAKTSFRIGELGFGTGLNFCETWRQWKLSRRAGTRLHFTSFELFPMKRDEIDRALARWPEINAERAALVAAWPDEPAGHVVINADECTRLTVACGPALEGVRAADADFDAWFLDGFAPSRNPDMWSPELMQALFDKTKPGGTFGTYAAAGFVRRNLGAAGFAVERRPGFAGKREMLCGVKAPAS
jgi:tRNA U34 5-methylaminomethyl-2-thiouridine-forming methyltransferase MnmC